MIEIFLLTFLVYIMYYFVSIRKFDKNGHIKNKKKKNSSVDDYEALPNEVKYFINKYKIDLNKVNLRGLLKLIGIVLGLDIAIVSVLVLILFENMVLQIVTASILIIPMYLVSLKWLAKVFKKKGLIKDV